MAAKSLQHPSQLLNREISSRISPAASLQEQIARSYVLGLEMQPLHTFNSWLPPSASAPSRQSRATAVRVLREPRTGTIILGNQFPSITLNACLTSLLQVETPVLGPGSRKSHPVQTTTTFANDCIESASPVATTAPGTTRAPPICLCCTQAAT